MYPLEEAIIRTAKLGYSGIEVEGFRPHLWPYDIGKDEVKSIRKLLKENHLEMPAITGHHFGLNLASSNKKERKDTSEYVVKCLELGADLGAKVYVLVPGFVVYGTSWDEAWKMSMDSMEKPVKRAAELDVVIAIEYVNTFWTNLVTTSDQAYKMMREFNSPNVKVMLDTVHAFYARENVVDVVRLFGSDLVHIHFEDCLRGEPERRAIPGQGDADLISCVQTLSEINYQGYLSIELMDAFGPQAEKYGREALEYTNSLLEKYA
jgi:sugar phosphate isomerase/epimerase